LSSDPPNDDSNKDEPQRSWSKLVGQKMPAPSFMVHVSALASQTLVHLGAVPHPSSGRSEISLELAGYTIGTLEVLEQKTQGNLESSEQVYLQQVLEELRQRFAAASKRDN